MATTTLSTDLPAPREALLELGLTVEEIAKAEQSAPLVAAWQAAEAPGAYFDVDAVKRALKALGTYRHTKGRWGGVPLRPDPWQVVWIIAPIFGWLRFDDEVGRPVRVIRTAWIEVPRKAGKSTLSSGLALVLLLSDREIGAEVYSAAGSLPQAQRIYDDAKRMVRTSRPAAKRVEVLADVMRVPATGGVMRALSKIAETAHGLNVSGAVVDEVHVHKHRDLIDAIETGTGARDQPLVIFITTADEGDDGTIYAEKHVYTRNVAARTVVDATHYGVIWAAEDADDPFADDTLAKANPGIGISPTWGYLRKEAAKAASTPSYFPTYCRLHLNLRMRQTARWFPLADWDAGAGIIDEAKLAGRRAWGALDLSAVSDLTAWVMVFEASDGGLDILPRFWLPEEVVADLERRLMVPLGAWVKAGWLKVTEGNVIDYGAVEEQVVKDAGRFDLQRVGYDRMFAGQLVQNVAERVKGLDVVPIAQTYLGLSPASKELERLVLSHQLHHGGHPVLRWHADMVEVSTDGQDNLKPAKPDRHKSVKRIDGIAAAVMAVDGWMRRPKPKTRRVAGF